MSQPAKVAFSVLIVDDDEALLKTLAAILRADGLVMVVTETLGTRVLDRIARERPGLVLLDLTMPGCRGQDLLRDIRDKDPLLPVIIVTGNSELDTAVACMKAGAVDYLVKPVDRQKLVGTVRTHEELFRLRRENAALARHLFFRTIEHPEFFSDITTRDPAMLAAFHYIEAVAESPHPFLITGETGTGKELFAAAIHRASGRTGALVTVNAAGLDDAMFSDVLFGHRKGAFTGADQPLRGLVERAAGGTLFLDEIGDLTPVSQVKLLRLAENGEYYAVGTDVVRRCSARLVLATNKDLAAAVAAGAFRSDLYYRLSTHTVAIPPLRERLMDLPLLVDRFVTEAARELGRTPPEVPRACLERMRRYPFPGNLREVKSLILNAVRRHGSGDFVIELPGDPQSSDPDAGKGLPEVAFGEALPTIRHSVHLLITEALRRTGGNQTAAARLVGISQQALSKRLKERPAGAGSAITP